MKYEFKAFYSGKSTSLTQDMEKQLNEFFRTNKHLIPQNISIAHQHSYSLTAIVLCKNTEEEEAD
jgi:hypothetical protein